MAILPDYKIRRLCLEQQMITPFHEHLLNPASLDVLLGENLMIESAETPAMVRTSMVEMGCSQDDPFLLKPGQFVLAETAEVFNIPDHVAAQFVLKSSRAREGIEHLMAGFADPGFNGSRLTLELHNSRQLHAVPLWPGMKIGQIVFHLMDGDPERSYRVTGNYNGQLTVAGSIGHV